MNTVSVEQLNVVAAKRMPKGNGPVATSDRAKIQAARSVVGALARLKVSAHNPVAERIIDTFCGQYNVSIKL